MHTTLLKDAPDVVGVVRPRVRDSIVKLAGGDLGARVLNSAVILVLKAAADIKHKMHNAEDHAPTTFRKAARVTEMPAAMVALPGREVVVVPLDGQEHAVKMVIMCVM